MSDHRTQDPGWLAEEWDSPQFQRLYCREDFIEEFLSLVEHEMQERRVTRSELARRLGCQPANVTQMFRRTRNLTASTMVDVAYVLGFKLMPRLHELRAENNGEKSARSTNADSRKVVQMLEHWRKSRTTTFQDSSVKSPQIPEIGEALAS